MGTGYTRNDTSNNIADGNIINAADLDGEFDAIESAMGTSGHTHDGTSAEGGPVTVLGPVQDFVASATEIKPKTTNTLDIGTSGLLFKDMFLDGVATVGSIKIDNAGTIGSASDSDAIAISSGGVVSFSQAPLVDVTNATTNAVTDVLGIQVQSSGTPAVGIGSGLTLGVETAAGNVETGGAIRSITTGLTPTAEEIDLVFYSMRNGNLTEGFRYDSSADNFDVTGSISIDGGSTSADFTFGDNDKAIFGAGSDLQIYHDGNHSIIEDAGTGAIKVKVGDFRVENASGNNLIKGVGDVATLHYDGSEKLATTNTGVDITGTLTSDEVTVQQSAFTRALIGSTGANGAMLVLDGDSNGDGSGGDYSYIYHNTSGQLEFLQDSPAGTNEMLFNTAGNNLRMKIGSGGDISFYEDTGTTAKFFWDASAESLGIGTSSPSGTLTVKDSAAKIHLTNDANTGSAEVTFRNTTGSNRGFVAYNFDSDYMFFRTNGSGEAMRIDSSGNVLIGSSTNVGPDSGAVQKLEVQGTGATETGYFVNHTASYSYSGIYNASDSETYNFWKSGNNYLFGTVTDPDTSGWDEHMRIDSSGNVGIGATGATNKLVVNRDSTTAATNAQIVSENRTGATGQYALYATSLDNGSGSGFKPVAFGAVQTAASGRTADFIVAVSDTDNVDLSADERMRIDSSGNVGIAVVPESNWYSVQNVLQVGTTAVVDNGSNDAFFGANYYYDGTNNKYINSGQAAAIGLVDGAHKFYTAPSGTADANITFVEAMTIDSSGHAIIPAGVTLGTAAGVYAAANTLDDYEEGIATLTMGGGTSNPSSTQSTNGYYTKIGNVVKIWFLFSVKDNTGASGVVEVDGLPFTVSATQDGYGTAWSGRDSAGDTNSKLWLAQLGTTSAKMVTGGGNNITWASTGSGTYQGGVIHYRTA